MAEQIYSIPINDALNEKCGCPLCRLKKDLEKKSLEYIMGAAMMEPDVRIATNKAGFCHQHYADMLKMKNRLSLALMTQTRLPIVKKALLSGKSEAQESCYVCNRINNFMDKIASNFIYLYHHDPEFRSKVLAQPYFCVPHYNLLISQCKQLKGKERSQFLKDLSDVETKYIDSLQNEVDTFCKSFDYRSEGLDISTAKYSCENSNLFLTGE